MAAYYNECDPSAAAWLRELIAQGHIANGDVDERSIEDVCPADLHGYTQCHFFAGIGVWSYALRQAGWSDDRPVWTGSCPCQPFSSAGKGAGFADERHLWPALFHLIGQCRPTAVFGEQVASKDGLTWFDLVRADLESAQYTCGALDTCAAGFGAPHIRQRLYWVAFDNNNAAVRHYRREEAHSLCNVNHENGVNASSQACTRGLADTLKQRQQGRRPATYSMEKAGERVGLHACAGVHDPATALNGFWRGADWLGCADGQWRPVEPSTCPVADGIAARMVRLRGYGNAIVAPQAQAFIEAAMEALSTREHV